MKRCVWNRVGFCPIVYLRVDAELLVRLSSKRSQWTDVTLWIYPYRSAFFLLLAADSAVLPASFMPPLTSQFEIPIALLPQYYESLPERYAPQYTSRPGGALLTGFGGNLRRGNYKHVDRFSVKRSWVRADRRIC